eukprot:EG_transcript_15178
MGLFSLFGGKKSKQPTEAEILASLGIDADLLADPPEDEDLDLDLDLAAACAGLDDGDLDGDVELTEADLQDPALLADLRELGWQSEEEQDAEAAEVSDEARLAEVLAGIEAGKERARELKAAGHTQQAVQELQAVKLLVTERAALEAHLAEAEAVRSQDHLPPVTLAPLGSEVAGAHPSVPEGPPAPPGAGPTAEAAAARPGLAVRGTGGVEAPPKGPPGDTADPIAALKRHVVALRQSGRPEEALQAFHQLKALQAAAASPTDPAAVASSSTSSLPKETPANPPPVALPQAAVSLQLSVKEVEDAIAVCRKEAVALKRAGDTEGALEVLKRVKRLEADRLSLQQSSG